MFCSTPYNGCPSEHFRIILEIPTDLFTKMSWSGKQNFSSIMHLEALVSTSAQHDNLHKFTQLLKINEG